MNSLIVKRESPIFILCKLFSAMLKLQWLLNTASNYRHAIAIFSEGRILSLCLICGPNSEFSIASKLSLTISHVNETTKLKSG